MDKYCVSLHICICKASLYSKKSLLVGENISHAAHLLKPGRLGTEESFHFVGNLLESF